jgi:hypothetical protein
MKEEIVDRWRLAKESRPDAIVFARNGDLYYLLGNDVESMKQDFGLRCFGDVLGLEAHEAWYYMRQFVQRGRSVIRAERSGASEVLPEAKTRAPRPRGRFIALEPRLVFEGMGLAKLRADDPLYERFRELLVRNDRRGISEHGEIYVFEFDGAYEVDWDLSTMLPSRVLMLARVAMDIREKIPCRLVLPRAWRGRRRRPRPRDQSEPAAFGQMRLEF